MLDRALRQTLESLRRAGVTGLPRPESRSWIIPQAIQQAPTETVAVAHVAPAATPSRPEPNQPAAVTTAPDSATEKSNMPASPAAAVKHLDQLAQRVAACTRCQELASTRTQTVFGVGNPQAQVMFIGEAPGADEDKQGEPFVGRAGQLLNKIIAACGWQREDLYICNILRCRPPGNRNPTPIEAGNCREYLDGQIAIVRPQYIVCWGTIAAQNLLGNNTPIGRLRGELYEHQQADITTKVLCTYHPSYLLRNPSAKKLVWEDLQILLRDMGIDPESLPKANS